MIAIAAVCENGGIGREGALLFHIREDLRRFRQLTLGKTVVMGRRTLESLPGGRGLPDRRNLVLTRDLDFTAPGTEVIHDSITAASALFLARSAAPQFMSPSIARRWARRCILILRAAWRIGRARSCSRSAAPLPWCSCL